MVFWSSFTFTPSLFITESVTITVTFVITFVGTLWVVPFINVVTFLGTFVEVDFFTGIKVHIVFSLIFNIRWATTWGDRDIIEERTNTIVSTIWRWIFNDKDMVIRFSDRDEEFSVLIVPDDRSFVTNGNIFTNLSTIEPDSENIGFNTWSTGSRIGNLIPETGF